MVGIKGVGMTPLALMFQDVGVEVQGSDTNQSQITDQILNDRKINVLEFDKNNIDSNIDLVVYSGAYKKSVHPELTKAEDQGIYSITQAEALATLISDKRLIAVCGVGGKTTTTGMTAQVFDHLGKGGWFVGVSQISDNLEPAKIDNSDLFVAEADEYAISPGEDNRPKFALYNPEVIICTNLAYDHPDIYPDFETTKQTFVDFFNRLPEGGLLIISVTDYQLIKDKLKKHFQVKILDPTSLGRIDLQVIGQMNQQNAQAVLVACGHLGIDESGVRSGLKQFSGTKRRLELIADQDEVLYMDDYGHHPDEIKLTLEAIKSKYPQRRLIVVFHPHTLSRTKALLTEFSQCFDAADVVILAPIFTSARESDDQSIDSAKLAQAIKPNLASVIAFENFDQIIDHLQEIRQPNDIILTLGAGDIYKIHEQLL